MLWAIVAVLVVGVAVAAALRLRRGTDRGPSIDPFTVGDPWRRHVSTAQSLQRGYQELVGGTPDGPLRDRMRTVERQVRDAVAECYTIAKRGNDLDAMLRKLDPPAIRARLERATDEAAATSLTSQLATTDRIRAIRDDADAKLRVLTSRMGELLSAAAEVQVGADPTAELGSAVDDVVIQLQALRQAVEDVNQVDAGTNANRQLPST